MPGNENTQNAEERKKRVEEVLKNHPSPISTDAAVLVGNILPLDHLFPGREDKIRELFIGGNMLLNKLLRNGHEQGMDGQDTICYHEDDKRKVIEHLANAEAFYKEVEADPSIDPKSVPGRMAKAMRRASEFFMEDHALELYKSDGGLFHKALQSTTVNMPDEQFYTGGTDEKGNPEFVRDEKRYEEMMKRIPFLDQLEEH